MGDAELYEQQLAKARGEGNRHTMGIYLSSLGNMCAGTRQLGSLGKECAMERIKQVSHAARRPLSVGTRRRHKRRSAARKP